MTTEPHMTPKPRMTPEPAAPLAAVPDAARVCFVHAHPDDETLSTGALIVHLVAQGMECDVVTCSRGEMGEVVPGPLSHLAGTPELQDVRRRELDAALRVLGVSGHAYLGTPPARVAGAPTRAYRDSGMQWVRKGVAGPADSSDQRSFTAASPTDAVDDLVAWLQHRPADLLVSYDTEGGYGHPDHVRAHEVARDAAARVGVPFAEVHHHQHPERPDMQWFDLPETLPTVQEALRQHATQLTVHGDHVVHSGGQLDPIHTSMGLAVV